MTELFTDFGLRDWLLILGPIFIAGILIHGYWRMQTNRNSLKMSLDKSFFSDDDDPANSGDELSMLRAELPNGGARVRIPEQTTLNLEEDVPVLMDSVAPEDDSTNDAISTSAVTSSVKTENSSAETVAQISDEEELGNLEAPEQPEQIDNASDIGASEQQAPEAPIVPPALAKNRPEKYVVMNVMAVGQPFKGQELLECLVEQDMALGEMSIFHRERSGQTQFSLMNAVEPGSFDLNTMNEIETPAVSMFMRVHELRQPIRVFEQMLHVAAALAEELGGEVRDESRSVMTTQTIEHCRQELEDYEFKNPA
jgi:cell division protein ZipA